MESVRVQLFKQKPFITDNNNELPKLVRYIKKITITKKEAGEIIKYRVKCAQIKPPIDWNAFNLNNVRLLCYLRVNYVEYDIVFYKRIASIQWDKSTYKT
jgi:hypothetical protein